MTHNSLFYIFNSSQTEFLSIGISANQIITDEVWGDPAETNAYVTIDKWSLQDYTNSTVAHWETVGVQNTNPTFTGGTLPTGFTGTYGIDMVPNTNYFAINSGDVLDTGVSLGNPYDSSIKWRN